MSFERFTNSDIYIYEHVSGWIECCGCLFSDWDSEPFPQLKTPREALAHLDRHEEAGHDIGGARRRIEKEYEDLDAPIDPYVRTPEEEARHEELFKRMKEAYDASQKDA
jgi:hypothetical protein